MKRAIVHQSSGHRGGPITRLASPGDLGELIKPLVFLDLFELDGDNAPSLDFTWHLIPGSPPELRSSAAG
jgi:hypothetical protein